MFTETFEKQYPIALQAIGLHMQAYDLPVPHLIEANALHVEEILVHVRPGDLTAWLDTVVVDDEHNDYHAPVDGRLEPYFVSRFDCRFPDTGIRFVVRAHRDLPFAVVAGGAS